MNKETFVYVTYIATTQEKVWEALVDSEMTRRYWAGPATDCSGAQNSSIQNVSDWKPGSRWESRRGDPERTVVAVGKVLESVPPSRLVMTWARPNDIDLAEKHSRVTFSIEAQGKQLVRLTILHDDLDPEMARSVSGGWPKVLSNLKTLLETGHTLSAPSAM